MDPIRLLLRPTRFVLLGQLALAILAVRGNANAASASPPLAVAVTPSLVVLEAGTPVPDPAIMLSSGHAVTPVASGSSLTAMPSFGGYNNNTRALTATVADGAGRYAVVGTNGAQAYLAIHSSADHARLCETAFVPVDYDQGHALAVAWGNGLVYVAGEAHDTTSTPDDFDAFVQAFTET